ncbi:MAG: trypsin-like peptidase domain-containing protein [Cyanobacteriota bacterium]
MRDVSIPTIKLYVQNPSLTKNVTAPKKTIAMTDVQQNPNLPRLAIPGFNDHNVILFGKKFEDTPVKKYQPIDPVEKNSMDVFKNVAPSVVKINSKATKVVMDPRTGETQEIPSGGSGSGSILDKEGHILTNFHVINGADEITVELEKEKEVVAKLIGSDPSTDLALLKLDLPKAELEKLPVMILGDSTKVEGGQRSFAIGNPFNLYRTMTSGIVSALGRSIISPGGRITKGVIQTDAPINPGNSGGALVNAKGEQIGINSQIYSPSGASAGLGFAIPVNTAKEVVTELKAIGRVIRPYLGLSGGVPVEMLPPQVKKILGLDEIKKGVMLQAVIDGGPGDLAGLKGAQVGIQFNPMAPPIGIGGDIITKVAGKPVGNMTEVFEILDEHAIGTKITIEYVNHNVEEAPPMGVKGEVSEPKTVTIVVGETPGPDKKITAEYNEHMPKPLEKDDLENFGLRS